LEFLKLVIEKRLQFYFKLDGVNTFSLPCSNREPAENPVIQLLVQHGLSEDELVIILLALVPHIQPNLLDSIIQQFLPQEATLLK
jgi:hypothetical protein